MLVRLFSAKKVVDARVSDSLMRTFPFHTYIVGIGCCEYRAADEPCGDQKDVAMHASVS